VVSAFQLCNLKNLIVVPSETAKSAFLETVYPHYIDCIVVTANEAMQLSGNYKVVFFGCFVAELSHCENLIMDDIILSRWYKKPYTIRWEPAELAIFLSCWFQQDKIRKMGNNQTWKFENETHEGRGDWLRKLMI
jgi:hypothetical protein